MRGPAVGDAAPTRCRAAPVTGHTERNSRLVSVSRDRTRRAAPAGRGSTSYAVQATGSVVEALAGELADRLHVERRGTAQRHADARPDCARQVVLDRGRHVRHAARSGLRERSEVELHRLRFDQRRRLDRHVERRERDLRLAARVEPGQLVRGPEVDAGERQRARRCRARRAAARAARRTAAPGAYRSGCPVAISERRVAKLGEADVGARSLTTRRIRAPSADSFSSMRS